MTDVGGKQQRPIGGQVISTASAIDARARRSRRVRTLYDVLGVMIASPFRELPSFNFKGMGDTLRFGGFVMAQRLVWWAYNGLDSVLIGRFYPAHSLGIYGTASMLATLPPIPAS